MMKIGYFISSLILTALLLFGVSSYTSEPINEQITFEEEDAEFNDDLDFLPFEFEIEGGGDGDKDSDSGNPFTVAYHIVHPFSHSSNSTTQEMGHEHGMAPAHQPLYILFCELKIAPVNIL